MNTLGAAAVLALAWTFFVGYILNAMFPPKPGGFRDLKLRVRRPAVTANPEGTAPSPAQGAVPEWRRRGLPDATGREPGPGLPAIDPATLAHLRRRMAGLPAHPHGVPIADTGAMHAVRDELLARNGVRLPDRPRKTVDMIICDPAVTPVVPRYYRAWLEGRWTP